MKLEDDHMVAGNDAVLVGQSPAVATLMPPAATPAVPIATTMGAGGGLFTAAQWVELQRQALIYKHMAASAPIPSYLLFSDINAAAAQAAPSPYYYYCYNATPLLLPHYQAQQAARMSVLLQCMQQAVARRRCGRTDGKKWRCARDAEPDQRYCQRHLNRAGRPRHPPPAKKQQQHDHAAAAVVDGGHRRDRHKSAHTDHGGRSSSPSSGNNSKAAAAGGLLEFAGGVCLPEQPQNRLSLDYDNIADLYCNKQVASMAAPSSSVMDDDASDHGGAATNWVGIGGPLGEVLGLAAQVQWPV